jgi:hypothetical protein
MKTTVITFNQKSVPVNLIGSDQKLIPSLLSALNNNKLSMDSIKDYMESIDLYGAEAVIHSTQGDKRRVPIF